ncbi:MAG: hypothetical protein SPI30_00175 [Prevotella sp.]|nr:hypothetical protein [Prevotella sp.]
MPIVLMIGSYSTSHWYGCYQCLVRTLPTIGTSRTAVQRGCHFVYFIGKMVFRSVRTAANLYLTVLLPGRFRPIVSKPLMVDRV